MVDGAQGTHKTAKCPPKKDGDEKEAKSPPESGDKTVARYKAGEPNQGVQLEKERYRLRESEIDITGENKRVLQVNILG